MATLVLTAVGTAIGGPIGGAIGALIGQRIDGELFKPKGREGPRLTDLAIQTSSYGDPIPRVFGTMRVAGCIIWSTDLIESRSTSRHKGQPSSTTYSYSASFAVLLSARRVSGVGRIWADGNLLRGAAGDFKTPTGFRLHPGTDDQQADPLIASMEGAGLSPGCRGCAYAVFENMQLADYGNRIPSLTFELIADDAATGAGAIAADIAGGAVVDSGVAILVPGFSAYGGSARDVVRLLATASNARFAAVGGALAMADAPTPMIEIEDRAMAASGERGGRVRRTTAAIESVPRTLGLAHYDAARDYQTSIQRARRPGPGTRDERVEMPASLSAPAAKALAETILARAEIERERRTIALAADAAAIAPGAIVAVAGETGRWRVVESALEAMVTVLTLVRVTAPTAATSASPGRVLPAPDRIAGTTIVRIAELPAPDDSPLAAPRLSVMAAGTEPGWRSAALLYSLDGGASWRDGGVSAAPAVIGTVVTPPAPAPATLFDLKGVIEIDLARSDMMLADADDAQLDSGANLALVGDELIQFGRADPVSANRWRLSRLLRGRRGTEWAIGGHGAGDRFVVLDAASVATIDLPVTALGSTVLLLASGIGDGDGPVAADCAVTGASIRPPAPAHLALRIAGGVSTVSWIRRSRAGFRWIDGADAPLVEEHETYRVTITPLAAPARIVATADPSCALTPDEAVAGTIVAVRQLGTVAESVPATLTII
ncbi:MAG: phage tail protein [Pseudomonadota bacterium]